MTFILVDLNYSHMVIIYFFSVKRNYWGAGAHCGGPTADATIRNLSATKKGGQPIDG